MATTPVPRPSAPGRRAPATRGTGWCVVAGLASGVGVSLLAGVLPVGPFGLVLLPIVAGAVGGLAGGRIRSDPRAAGVAFLVGAAVWAVLGAGGGLLWPVRVLVGLAGAAVAAAVFATAVAWRHQRRPRASLPPG